jgi:hypothetical protein
VFRERIATIPTGQGGANDVINSIVLTDANKGSPTNNFAYPGPGAQQPYNADYVRDITQATGQPQYKMLWAPVNSAVYDVRWQLTLDSTLLPDGDMTMHYIVVDAAGNASYYEQAGISVRNNYPEITRVTLYTNNDGQGAAYTADAIQTYDLNNYRSKMFANYTDSADYNTKAKTTGYLNSGFISKNQYIGFKVETTGGNRTEGLNFRLQHVKRTRLRLDAPEPTNTSRTVLEQMVLDRTAPGKINLYTIAWHGNYTPQKWKALGVPIENNPNPTLGTHFVFNPVNITDPAKDFDVAEALGTAEVWRYTAVLTKDDIRNPTVPGYAQDADPFVYGPNTDLNPTPFPAAAGTFEFKQAAHFSTTDTAKINEYYGSHPDAGAGDLNADDPDNTAFFLIRVWDSVNDTNRPAESWVNDQLYDAVVVGMNVYQSDKNAPVARLYDLNPYTETAVIEGNKPQTIKDAANPSAIGGNIIKGGLYNDGTSRAMVRSGFIDPRGNSTALAPKNGVYYKEDLWLDSQLINGAEPPASSLKVEGDAVPTTTANDKVSGKIILRGFAWDDQLIDEIRISIGGGAANPILKLTNGKMAATGAGLRTIDGKPVTIDNPLVPVAFAEETLHWKTGHSVEWAYIWDTTLTHSAPTTTPVQIQVSVKDLKGSNNTGLNSASISVTDETTNPAVSKKYHNTVSVDVVPYITGFERAEKFVTKRSLQGWYSFYQGETGIKVKGYNFGTGGTNTISLNGTDVGTVTVNSAAERTFSIPGGGVSGAINMTANGVPAYNNYAGITDVITYIKTKSWNREFNAYTPGSDLWINRHYAHILRTTVKDGSSPRDYIGSTTGSSGLNHPGMALEYIGGNPGTIHGTWAVYGNANSYYGTNTGDFYPLHTPTPGEPFSTPDISIYNGGGAGAGNIAYTYQPDGRPRILVRSRIDNSLGTNTIPDSTIIQASTVNGSTQRWQNIRISKAAANTDNNETNVGRVYITAYNADFKSLWYGSRSGSNTTMIIDGGSVTGINNIGTSGLAAAASAGEYSAVDYDDVGPIIAYYDASNDTVRVALGTNLNPGTGDWTRRYLLPSTGAGSELYRGSGKYISIKVDKGYGIHLSFFNSVNNTVVYYYAQRRANIGTAPNGTTVKCHAIDSVVSGGTWSDISVDNDGNPWIVYGDNSRTNNYDGARIAYKGAFTRTLTDPVSKSDITGWEALTMPADYTVGNDRLNIESWPPTNRANGTTVTGPTWNAAVGYPSDLFRVGYFTKPTLPPGF